MKAAAKSIVTATARRTVRALRAIGTPLVNTASAGRRRRDDLARPIDRQTLAALIGDRPSLEIGPFFTPLLKGRNVAYFDVLDTTALRRRAESLGADPDNVPEIEFVSSNGDLGVVDRAFSTVVSAHVVEHQPDLIRHLEDIADILTDDGEYWLIVPDRRYSFDQGFSDSSLEEIIKAHLENRQIHTPENIIAHLSKTVHNNALLHWFGWHGKPRKWPGRDDFANAESLRAKQGEYVDVHAWIFSPISFKFIINELNNRRMIRLFAEIVTETAFGKLEFFAKLKLSK